MARYNQEWDDLGRSIQDAVDRAVNSRDFQKLDQTIRQVVGRAVDMGSEAVRMVKDNAEKRPELPVLYGSTGGKNALAVLKTAGGAALAGVTFPALVGALVMNLMGPAILALAGLGAAIFLVGSGVKTIRRMRRFKSYRRLLGEKTHCTLEKLARGVGKSVKFVRRELQAMFSEGLFLQGHMDHEQTMLITSDETFQRYEQGRKALEERQRQAAEDMARIAKENELTSPQVREVLERGNAFLVQIRRCNDAIPGEEISAKIDRMEIIVRRIFERARAHPEIIPDLKKLMNYYLPMTVKLLDAYADMDAQPVQGENIRTAKQEIEASLDTLNSAFEKLLDSVFEETALDVSSDISVLTTLLAQEGLAEDDFGKMKKQNS